MATDLLESFQQRTVPNLLNQATDILKESPEDLRSAMNAIAPSLFGSVVQYGEERAGLTYLLQKIDQEGIAEVSEVDLSTLASKKIEVENLLQKGSGYLDILLDTKTPALAEMVANFAGIRQSSAHSLMSLTTPFLLNHLREHIQANSLDTEDVQSLLNSQSRHIKSAMPAAMSGVGDLLKFKGELGTLGTTVNQSQNTVEYAPEGKKNKGFQLLPWVAGTILLFLLLGYFLDWRKGGPPPEGPISPADELEAVAESTSESLDAAAKAAREKLNEISFEGNSAADKLYNFLKSGKKDFSREVYELKNADFETGSTNIPEAMKNELDNLAEVLQAYPNVELEVAAHTDNNGNAGENRNLSQGQAEAVKNYLMTQGIPENRINARGYGADRPIGDNETEAGRALNRRIEILIRKI